MTYLEQFELELAHKLAGDEKGESDGNAIIKWVLGKMLESYKNGLAAGRRKNRSKGSPSKAQ